MRLRLLSLLSLFICIIVGAKAQSTTNEVVFVNDKDETITPHSTLVQNKVESALFDQEKKQMAMRLFISNKLNKAQKVKLSYTITNMEEGNLTVCTLGDCTSQQTTGVYQLGPSPLNASQKEELSIEHIFTSKGKCKVTLQLFISEVQANGVISEKEGPQITIDFIPDDAGITALSLQEGSTFDVFNTKGMLLYKQLTTLTKLPKGVYIIKYKGKKGKLFTRKYIAS